MTRTGARARAGRRELFRALLAAVALSAAPAVVVPSLGCGYALVGSSRGTLPEDVKTVSVPTFVNQTARVGLEQQVTDAVLRELAARRRLKPVPPGTAADSELAGTLLSYGVAPVRFDDSGRAVEYDVAVTARIVLTDKKTEKVLFENGGFLFRQPYKVPAAQDYADVEPAVVSAIAQPLARSLVTTILEGF
jgi:hypothetical protein